MLRVLPVGKASAQAGGSTGLGALLLLFIILISLMAGISDGGFYSRNKSVT